MAVADTLRWLRVEAVEDLDMMDNHLAEHSTILDVGADVVAGRVQVQMEREVGQCEGLVVDHRSSSYQAYVTSSESALG